MFSFYYSICNLILAYANRGVYRNLSLSGNPSFHFSKGVDNRGVHRISKFYCLQGVSGPNWYWTETRFRPPPLSKNSFIRPWLIMSLIFLPYGSLSCHRSPPRTRHKTVFHRTTSRTCTPLDSTNQPQNHTGPDRPP